MNASDARRTAADLQHAYFEPMYRDGADPYGVRDRWYEKRKRMLLLASLPRARFARAFEPACGIGALTLELAPRCGALLACDFSASAVATARSHTGQLAHVRIECLDFAHHWPVDARNLDLIVLSEIGYFLAPDALEAVVENCHARLTPEGALVACHWIPDFAQRTQATDVIHQRLGSGLHALCRHAEADFLLDVWSPSARSVAQEEGIREA